MTILTVGIISYDIQIFDKAEEGTSVVFTIKNNLKPFLEKEVNIKNKNYLFMLGFLSFANQNINNPNVAQQVYNEIRNNDLASIYGFLHETYQYENLKRDFLKSMKEIEEEEEE